MNNIYIKIVKKWYLAAFITSFGILWLGIYEFVPEWFVDDKGVKKSIFQYITIVMIFLSFIVNIIKAIFERGINEYNDNGQDILKNIISSLKVIEDTKIDTITKKFGDKKSTTTFFYMLSCDLMRQLFVELNSCLSNITGLSKEDIGISIICKNSNGEWYFHDKLFVTPTTTAKKIMKNNNSVASRLFSNKNEFLFEPSKRIAYDNNRYEKSPKDINNNYNGSILCQLIKIKDITGILCITSYSKPIYTPKQKDKEEIIKYILKSFSEKIKMELIKMHMKTVAEQYKTSSAAAATSAINSNISKSK